MQEIFILLSNIYAIVSFDNILIAKAINTIFINILLKNLDIKDIQVIIIRANTIVSLTNARFVLASIR